MSKPWDTLRGLSPIKLGAFYCGSRIEIVGLMHSYVVLKFGSQTNHVTHFRGRDLREMAEFFNDLADQLT